MDGTRNSFLDVRLTALAAMARLAEKGRRTPGGRLRACGELGKLAGMVRQLHTLARSDEEHRRIDEAVDALEARRAELSDDGRLADRVRRERQARRERRAANRRRGLRGFALRVLRMGCGGGS